MSAPHLFDRPLIARRLNRALAATPADFLLRRVVDDLEERLALIKREFADALDLGAPGPHAAAALKAARVTRIAPTAASLGAGRFDGRIGDPGQTPIGEAAFDLVVSLLALHAIDDLPGALIQIRRALKPDGLLIAALLQRAGFALPVVDSDRFTVRYADMFALMRDLRAFGATNPLIERSRRFAPRELFLRAAQTYAERFADADGRVRATFEILWLAGWAPHPSQQKPLAPGSAKMRLEDAVKQKRP